MLATTAVAQVNTNKLPAIPAPAIAAPAAAPAAAAPAASAKPEVKKAAPAKHKKKPVAKPAATVPASPAADKSVDSASSLVSGAATVRTDNANLRGQAGLKGEVVGQLKKGETVTVLSLINLDKPKAGEPAHWAKVALPAGLKVWVNSKFIDATNKVVAVKKLNLRAGAGENYSVLGVIEKGAEINSLSTRGDWIQIATPTNAFAFVAAGLLKQDAAAVAAAVIPPAPATTSMVPEAQPIVTQPVPVPPAVVPSEPAPVTPPPVAAPAPVTPSLPPVTNAAAELVDTNPPPPRVVSHEGFVRPSVSVVAPTYYELYDPGTSVAINYLYPPTTNLNVARYNGLHIVVTGEEGLDSRWRDTPMLKIQKIYVLSTNAPSAKKP